MRIKRVITYIVAAAVVLSVTACAVQPVSSVLGQGSSEPESGRINVTVRGAAHLLWGSSALASEGVARAGEFSPQAVALAGRIEFDLKDAGGSTVDDWILSDPPIEQPGMPINSSQVVAPNDGYTLEARVFNTTVSETTPVVTGTSAPFTVGAGGVQQVNVVCTPDSPTNLPQDTPVSTSGTPSLIEEVGGAPTSFGSEHWYTFTVPSATEYVELSVLPDADDDYATSSYFMVFDSSGAPTAIGASTSFVTWEQDSPAVKTIDVVPDATYYVVVLPMSFHDDAGANFDVLWTSSSDPNEEDDTTASAQPISKDTVLSGKSVPPPDAMTNETSESDFYAFSLPSTATVRVDFVLTDGFGAKLQLLDETGAVLDETSFQIFHGTEHYIGGTALPGGNYYIEVASGSDGGSYELSWTTVSPQDDTHEENDATASAPEIPMDTEISGVALDIDYYKVTLNSPATLTTFCSYTHGDNTRIDMSIWNDAGEQLVFTEGDPPTGPVTKHLRASDLAAGTYYVRIGDGEDTITADEYTFWWTIN